MRIRASFSSGRAQKTGRKNEIGRKIDMPVLISIFLFEFFQRVVFTRFC